jgi:hypothetical protein
VTKPTTPVPWEEIRDEWTGIYDRMMTGMFAAYWRGREHEAVKHAREVAEANWRDRKNKEARP